MVEIHQAAAESFDQAWVTAVKNKDRAKQNELRKALIDYLTAVRRSTDEIIVPTGQLFIEGDPRICLRENSSVELPPSVPLWPRILDSSMSSGS